MFDYPNFFFLDHPYPLSKFLRTQLGTDQLSLDQKSLQNELFCQYVKAKASEVQLRELSLLLQIP